MTPSGQKRYASGRSQAAPRTTLKSPCVLRVDQTMVKPRFSCIIKRNDFRFMPPESRPIRTYRSSFFGKINRVEPTVLIGNASLPTIRYYTAWI